MHSIGSNMMCRKMRITTVWTLLFAFVTPIACFVVTPALPRRPMLLASTPTSSDNIVASLSLQKPLGLLLEEVEQGAPRGVFVADLAESGSAVQFGDLIKGTRLSTMNGVDVTAYSFDAVMEAIIDAPAEDPIVFEFASINASTTESQAAEEEAETGVTDYAIGTKVTIQVQRKEGETLSLEAAVGDNLRKLLLENNVEVYQGLKQTLGNCGGGGQCTFCAFDFLDDSDRWLERSDYEDQKLKKFPKARLTCLNNIQGPATIQKTER